MRVHNRQSNQRNGSVTALILLVSIILMLLGMSMILISMHERTFAVRSGQIIAAKAAADSGLTEAVYNFNSMLESQSVDLSLLNVSGVSMLNSDATFDCTVAEGDPGEYQIVSTGHAQATARTVRATLSLHGLFENAIAVKNTLSLSPGSQIIGINSLDAFDTELDVTIGTISTGDNKVPMGPGTVINGDAFVGVGGNPSDVIVGSGIVSGDRYALEEELVFPVITPPSCGIIQPKLNIVGVTKTMTPADSGCYNGLELSKSGAQDARLFIDGGKVILHLTGDLNIGNICEIIIKPGASLVMYLDGNSFSGTDSFIDNTTNNPMALQIFGTGVGGKTLVFKPKVTTFGLIYAPNNIVKIAPQAKIQGSVVAYDFEMLSQGEFIYDKAVQQVSIDDLGVRLVLDYWSE